MPIDPSIALRVRQPEIESPLNALAKVSQVQGLMNQNRLADLAFAESQRKQQRQNALMQATRNAFDPETNKINPDKYRGALAEIGDFEGLQSFEKSLAEQNKAGAEADYKKAQTGEINTKTLNAKFQQQRDVLNMVNDQQSAAGWLTAAWSDPDVGAVMRRTGKTLEQAISEIPADPAGFQKWKMQSSLGAEKMIEYTTPNANTVANNQTSRANNAASIAQQERASLRADARARERLDFERGNAVAEAGGPNQAALTKRFGKASAGYRWKPDGSQEAIPGGPSDVKALAESQRQADGATDVDIALSTLRDAYDRLDEGGGITSTEKGPLENMAAATSSSAIGQGVGKLFGTRNQSARNDIAMSRPALLAALMKATGMSAKQMDSNAELKLWLATATDPTLDVQANRKALENIEKKYLRREQPVKPNAPKQPNIEGLTSEEQRELEELRAKFGGRNK